MPFHALLCTVPPSSRRADETSPARCDLPPAPSATGLQLTLTLTLSPTPTQDCAERDEAISTFYERAKANKEALVINKWLGVQASSQSPAPSTAVSDLPYPSMRVSLTPPQPHFLGVQAAADTPTALQTVKDLMSHEGYDGSNPNSIRSLVQMFASANPAAFHSKDGSGYDFIGEQVRCLSPAPRPRPSSRTFHALPRASLTPRWPLHDPSMAFARPLHALLRPYPRLPFLGLPSGALRR